jgi:hypothetical protein
MHEPKEESEKTSDNGVIIRGADGELYMLTEDALSKFKLTKQQNKEVTEILKESHENPVPAKLPQIVIDQIKNIKTPARGIILPPHTIVNVSRRD